MNGDDHQDGIRVNRFLSESGVASRRGSDKIILERRITIDGKVAVLGDKVFPDSEVCVDGKRVTREKETIILAFNKPVGITSTSDSKDKNNVIDFIGYSKRIHYVGRLDKDSEGLMLLTNDGDLADRIMRSRNEHEKEYVVKVNMDITPDFIEGMAKGVPILDGRITKKCSIEMVDMRVFNIILKQGLNRQIRRMCEHFGYEVTHLKRIRVMNIELGDLEQGKYRNLTKLERDELYSMLNLK